MPNPFSLKNTWDLVAALLAVATFIAAMHQFVIGQHYIIPTMILFWCVLFGNLARYGLRGTTWAKYILFWFGFLMTCMSFMGIFMAKQPKETLGAAFLPVAIVIFILVAFLTWQYRQKNELAL